MERGKVNPQGGRLRLVPVEPMNDQSLDKQARQYIKAMKVKMPLEEVKEHLKNEWLNETWINDKYQVSVMRNEQADEMVHSKELKGRCTWISIKRRDKKAITSWQDLQTIKNRLCGCETDAFQIFPKESRMHNTVNQYHLIVLPEEIVFPFGWMFRAVVTKNLSQNKHGVVQTFNGERL